MPTDNEKLDILVNKVKNEYKNKRTPDSPPGKLEGACLDAAPALTELLKKQGYAAHTIRGFIHTDKKHVHNWTQLFRNKTTILDPTLGQFNRKLPEAGIYTDEDEEYQLYEPDIIWVNGQEKKYRDYIEKQKWT